MAASPVTDDPVKRRRRRGGVGRVARKSGGQVGLIATVTSPFSPPSLRTGHCAAGCCSQPLEHDALAHVAEKAEEEEEERRGERTVQSVSS